MAHIDQECLAFAGNEPTVSPRPILRHAHALKQLSVTTAHAESYDWLFGLVVEHCTYCYLRGTLIKMPFAVPS